MKRTRTRGNPPPCNAVPNRLLVGALVLLLACFALQSPASELESTNDNVQLAGPDVPYYICVSSFYKRLAWTLGLGEEHWVRVLDELGVKPGSEAERLVLAGVSRYELELGDRTLDPTPWENDEAAWDQVQKGFIVAGVDLLRQIHLETLEGLELEGVSRWDVDDYINQHIRPSLSLASVGGFDPRDIEPFAGMDDLTRGGAQHE